MINVKIKTKGMHCNSCEMLIVDSLKELNGVNKAEASHKTGIVSVELDEKKVSKNDIIELIKIQGYDVE